MPEVKRQFPLFLPAHAALVERVEQVLAKETLPIPERMVLMALSRGEMRLGRDKALSIEAMQSIWRDAGRPIFGDRTIKAAVKSLLEAYEVPIGSCRVPGRNGYFLIVSDQDAEEAARALVGEFHSLFRRIRVLSPRSSLVRRLNGQMEMEG